MAFWSATLCTRLSDHHTSCQIAQATETTFTFPPGLVCSTLPWHLFSQALILNLPIYILQSFVPNACLPSSVADIRTTSFVYLHFLYPLLPETGELCVAACYSCYLYIFIQRSTSCLKVFSSSCTLWVCIGQKMPLNVIPQTLPTFFWRHWPETC